MDTRSFRVTDYTGNTIRIVAASKYQAMDIACNEHGFDRKTVRTMAKRRRIKLNPPL